MLNNACDTQQCSTLLNNTGQRSTMLSDTQRLSTKLDDYQQCMTLIDTTNARRKCSELWCEQGMTPSRTNNCEKHGSVRDGQTMFSRG
eukprot:1856978-Rhodomonas_salina.1